MSGIVVLDGYTVNPGDLSWRDLEGLGECRIYDRTPPGLTVERCEEAEAVLTNKVEIDAFIMESLPKLRYIGVLATGYNVVDIAAARGRGIVVTNVPAYSTSSVAQMTFALILELANNVAEHSDSAKSGEWAASPDFCFWNAPLIELDGLTIGIVGFGAIGRAVAKIADSFGMRVVANTANPDKYIEAYPEVGFLELDAIFADSDIVTLHCPLNESTAGIIDARRLGLMKRSAYLINTARGPLIDEAALVRVLSEGGIAGAAVDVLSTEPPFSDNPLLKAGNCLVTPHIAWATSAARRRLLDTAVANVAAFLGGAPENMVT